jgi:hypothetical protein
VIAQPARGAPPATIRGTPTLEWATSSPPPPYNFARIPSSRIASRCGQSRHLNTRWDLDAYGSAVWVVLGLHTTHLVTDLVDTLVLTALMFTRHATPRRFSDVSDNAFYWNFVVLAWLPLYLLLYWAPRL